MADRYASRNNDQVGTFTGDFFADFQRFYDVSKKSTLITTQQNENIEYADQIYGAKNGYLSFAFGFGVENVLYSTYVVDLCRNVMNSVSITHHSDNIFDCKNVRQSFNIFYSANISNSSDLRFCSNCIGCHHCIDCDCLENKSYCINNQQLSKEDYQQQKAVLLSRKADFPKKQQLALAKIGNINAPQST